MSGFKTCLGAILLMVATTASAQVAPGIDAIYIN